MKMLQFILLLIFLIMISTMNAQQWKMDADSAKAMATRRENVKAGEYFQKASAVLKKDSAGTHSWHNLANEAAEFYFNTGQYAKSVEFYLEVKSAAEIIAGKNSAEYASACNNLGRAYRTTGQYQLSEDLLLEGKNLREKLFGKENADYASSCNNLAVLYLEVGMYNEAAPLYTEALQIRERVLGKMHIDYAASCNNLAILYVMTGKPELAEPLYTEAKNIREKVLGKSHPFYAASCNNLAALYLDMGQYRKAEALYLEAKEIRANTLGRQHPDYASSCDNLAILYMDTGKYGIAEALYLEAREIRERSLGKSHQEFAKGSNNLGLLYRTLGQYERAEPLLTEARNVLGNSLGKQHFEYAKSCNNLGALYMDRGDYEKAAELYGEARSVWQRSVGIEHPEYAKSCHNLALVNRHLGRFDTAVLLFSESLRIREKVYGKFHSEYASGADNLAVVYADMKEYNKASSLYLQAREIKMKVFGTSHPDFLQTSINLANLYRLTGKTDSAAIFFKEAFETQQSLARNIFLFTTEPEKQAYLAKVNEYRNYFLSFTTSAAPEPLPEYTYNISLANRNTILQSSQQLKQIVHESRDSVLAMKYQEWIDAREQLAFWYSKPVSQRKVNIKEQEEKANQVEKELVRRSMSFGRHLQYNTVADIKAALKPGEAAVEFLQFNYYDGRDWTDSIYYMAVVQKYGASKPQLIRLFEQKTLDALVGNSGSSPGERRINALYRYNPGNKEGLYSLVWKPLEKILAGIKTVYFSPAGDLHKISIAAIPVNSTQTLSDRFDLVQLNTTSSVATASDQEISVSDIMLYGGVEYNAAPDSMKRAVLKFANNDMAGVTSNRIRGRVGEFSYLSQTESEIRLIDSLARSYNYRVKMENGISANEESVKSLSVDGHYNYKVGRTAPAILHIATHGFFFPDPAPGKGVSATGMNVFRYSDNSLIRSGLAFAGANNIWTGNPVEGIEDGILTAYEVSNLYLPGTKLAVLSACETGLGRVQGSEGVYGLQRGFRMAGVSNLVMSLWKVPDAETAEFMKEFYQHLFSTRNISLAFQNTRQVMREKYRNEPYKWGAWILVR